MSDAGPVDVPAADQDRPPVRDDAGGDPERPDASQARPDTADKADAPDETDRSDTQVHSSETQGGQPADRSSSYNNPLRRIARDRSDPGQPLLADRATSVADARQVRDTSDVAGQQQRGDRRDRLAPDERAERDRMAEPHNGAAFPFDSPTLIEHEQARFLELFAYAIADPEAHFHLRGGGSKVGDHDYNLELSHRRAESVRDFLIEQGVDPSRITISAVGTDIADPMDPAWDVAEHRIVEVTVSYVVDFEPDVVDADAADVDTPATFEDSEQGLVVLEPILQAAADGYQAFARLHNEWVDYDSFEAGRQAFVEAGHKAWDFLTTANFWRRVEAVAEAAGVAAESMFWDWYAARQAKELTELRTEYFRDWSSGLLAGLHGKPPPKAPSDKLREARMQVGYTAASKLSPAARRNVIAGLLRKGHPGFTLPSGRPAPEREWAAGVRAIGFQRDGLQELFRQEVKANRGGPTKLDGRPPSQQLHRPRRPAGSEG